MTSAAGPAAAPHPDDPGTPDVPGSSGERGPDADRSEGDRSDVDRPDPSVAGAASDRTPAHPAVDPVLPGAWAHDPFLLDERTWWRPAHVETRGDAMLLVQRASAPVAGDAAGPVPTMLLAAGPADDVAALVRAHDVRTHRFAWIGTAALDVLHVDEVARLGLTPNRTGWEWMVTEQAPPQVAAEVHVRELDPHRDAAAIRACLAVANPTTDADPEADGERWWGVVEASPDDAGRPLGGVIGASPRAGRPGGRGTAHLHGLGVRPGERGRGFGAALTAAATRALLADGADWVSLGMWDDNHTARRLYHRLGLRTVHRLTTFRRP